MEPRAESYPTDRLPGDVDLDVGVDVETLRALARSLACEAGEQVRSGRPERVEVAAT